MKRIKKVEARAWVGISHLGALAFIGTYLLLVPSPLLPLEATTKSAGFHILIPYFLSQVVLTWQFYSKDSKIDYEEVLQAPAWVVKCPILIAGLILLILFGLLAAGGISAARWTPSPSAFMNVLALVVSILAATSAYVSVALFRNSEDAT